MEIRFAYTLAAAFVLELILGGPLWLFHPVRWMGRVISRMEVDLALISSGLPKARNKVSYIVGRETQHLSEQGVIRAAVETVAENLVDGIISPLFYAAIGGAPLAIAYR